MIIPAADRTLVVGTYVGIAPRGRIASQTPLRWPNKAAGAVLDYSLDFSSVLAAMGDDTILAATTAVTPSHVGTVMVTLVQIVGAVVTLLLAQGIAGEDYGLSLVLKLASGRTPFVIAGLYVEVSALPLPTPLYVGGAASVITSDAGAVITDDAGRAITTDGVLAAQAVGSYTPPAASSPAPAPASVALVAAVSISGFLAVAVTPAGLVPADSSSASLAGAVVGIATNGANAGGSVAVADEGAVAFNGWSWVAGQPVFIGAGGVLTQTPPDAGFLQIVGTADGATSLIVSLQSPIIL